MVGIVALVAGGLALVALLAAGVLALRLRRVRAGQRAVLGEHGTRDLVDHAAELERAYIALHEEFEAMAALLDERLQRVERRLAGAITRRSLVRYDAFNEHSGHQSVSVALLDDTHSGVVFSSILHRDQARLYAKEVKEGSPELELSPEEAQAVHEAGERIEEPKP